MSVRQLVFYHSVLATHKIVTSGKPRYLHRVMSTHRPLQTRQATSGEIWLGDNFDSKSDLVQDSFKYRASKGYNRIPGTLRAVKTPSTFKRKLKHWVSTNIPVD